MASQLDNLTAESATKLAGDTHKEKFANAPLLFFSFNTTARWCTLQITAERSVTQKCKAYACRYGRMEAHVREV